MGEFLDENSQVENSMVTIVIVCQRRHRPPESVFVEFMDETFGCKIKIFERVCKAYPFTQEQRAILEDAYKDLDVLLKNRNWIVHGTTYQIGKDGIAAQPYRLGMTIWKRGDIGNYDFMNKAITQDFNVPHAFSVEKLAAVTAACVALREKLQKVGTELMHDWVSHP